ncbi:Protocadherin-1 [Paragonimus heterotremus]|uniref:Protocadherin-1 n=1 Tax=Paragonimus heterotremus TaxID=100268 RepID=A0A8J4TEV2_9TREM|nr:Protocadherin-1 [Paragonimus heterotremus]
MASFGYDDNATSESLFLQTKVIEEYPVGHVILRLPEAIAQHTHAFSSKGYQQIHLMPTHDWTYFRINSEGSLVNSRRLDYESLCKRSVQSFTHNVHNHASRAGCELLVKAVVFEHKANVNLDTVVSSAIQSDMTSNRMSHLRYVTISISLLDVNDNRPECKLTYPAQIDWKASRSFAVVEIPDNSIPGEIIAKWNIVDRDSSANGISEVRLFGTKNGQPSVISNDLPFHLKQPEARPPWSEVEMHLLLTRRLDYSMKVFSRSKHVSEEVDWFDLKIVILDSTSDQTDKQAGQAIAFPGSSICAIRIRIIDINDHSPAWKVPPQFAKGEPIELELFEGKSFKKPELFKMMATDLDRGPNAVLSYHYAWEFRNDTVFSDAFPSSKMFESESYVQLIRSLFFLDSTTGELKLRSLSVDFETVKDVLMSFTGTDHFTDKIPLQMQFLAMDHPKNRSTTRFSPTATITVWLLNVNDNAPDIQVIGLQAKNPTDFRTRISDYTDVVYISENLAPNQPVAIITVTDLDNLHKEQIMCLITDELNTHSNRYSSTNMLFQLVRVTSELSVTPSFDSEGIAGTSAVFTRQVQNYKLVALRSLDREEQPSYRLNISCVDTVFGTSMENSISQTYSSLTSFRTIDIVVTDVNDNPPRIVGVFPTSRPNLNMTALENDTHIFYCSVKEHSSPGSKICQLKAEDSDRNLPNSFEWWIEESTQALMSVERNTGWLVVPSADVSATEHFSGIDRERMSEISVLVFVRDNGNDWDYKEKRLTSSATVIIDVIDVNDCEPKISEYNYFKVSEAAKSGTLIGMLTPVDEDQSGTPNSALLFQIASSKVHQTILRKEANMEDQESFDIFRDKHNKNAITLEDIELDSRTGAIRVSAAGLDRERRSFYKFMVTISDGQAVAGLAALPPTEQHHVHTIVHIEVEDENDNAPRIIYPETRVASFVVACSSLNNLPYTIARISVNDSDAGANAEVLYFLSPSNMHSPHNIKQDKNKFDQLTKMPGHKIINATEINKNFTVKNGTSVAPQNRTKLNETSRDSEVTLNNVDEGFRQPGSFTLYPFQIDPQTGCFEIIGKPEDNVCDRKTFESGSEQNDAVTYRMRVVVIDRGIPPLSSEVELHVLIMHADDKTKLMNNVNEKMHNFMDATLRDANNPYPTSLNIPSQSLGLFRNPVETEPTLDESNLWGSLNSPDVFWAAAICLTIATCVLIFLTVLITLVTCHRRTKQTQQETVETHQNEWANEDSPCDSWTNTLPHLITTFKRHPETVELEKSKGPFTSTLSRTETGLHFSNTPTRQNHFDVCSAMNTNQRETVVGMLQEKPDYLPLLETRYTNHLPSVYSPLLAVLNRDQTYRNKLKHLDNHYSTSTNTNCDVHNDYQKLALRRCQERLSVSNTTDNKDLKRNVHSAACRNIQFSWNHHHGAMVCSGDVKRLRDSSEGIIFQNSGIALSENPSGCEETIHNQTSLGELTESLLKKDGNKTNAKPLNEISFV